jgi:hypothetical protein
MPDQVNCNCGEVAEWLIAPVLKTGVGETPPGVRIPPSPPVSRQIHPDFSRHATFELIDAERESALLEQLELDREGLFPVSKSIAMMSLSHSGIHAADTARTLIVSSIAISSIRIIAISG